MRNILKSLRAKLFLTLCIVILIIICFLIVVSNTVLETFYYYSKHKTSIETFNMINEIDFNDEKKVLQLDEICITNNFDVVVKNQENQIVYVSNKDFSNDFGDIVDINYTVKYNIFNKDSIMYSDKNVTQRKIQDQKTGISFILLKGKLKNGNTVFIRIPVLSIKESVEISNKFLYLIAAASVVIGWMGISVITQRFTNPILELNDIAKKMSNLDFSKKYKIITTGDEINELGNSINVLSERLETTINQLKINNRELEKDIERKSKIDEMRKRFISDISHELKTPIAIIQGYAEGLIENVNTDEASRNFYSEVIIDEANKMDKLVKELLQLMKLEYDTREFENTRFNIVEMIQEVIRKNTLISDKKIKIEFNKKDKIFVFADPFYIDQVITNYFTNALKNVQEVNNQKKIKIKIIKRNNNYRISIFNTGKNIEVEDLDRIWNRFYKVDESRARENSGSGIGLSIVKAIMVKYKKEFGVVNLNDGVEFYFDVEAANEK